MQKPAICKDFFGSHYYILHCFESGYMQKPDICKNLAGFRAFAYTRILLYIQYIFLSIDVYTVYTVCRYCMWTLLLFLRGRLPTSGEWFSCLGNPDRVEVDLRRSSTDRHDGATRRRR